MNNEDNNLLGKKAKDETEDFINEHLENPDQGWPTYRLDTNPSFEEYDESDLDKFYAKYNLFCA